MSAAGLGKILAEQGHTVNILPPVDITGGATGDVFSMRNHQHVTMTLAIGVSAAAFTAIIVNQVDDFAGAGAVAIPFRLYAQEVDGGDVLGPREQIAAAGRAPSANDNIFYLIEIDAVDLADGKEHIQLSLTNGVNSVIASATAFLHGARYGGDQSATEIA